VPDSIERAVSGRAKCRGCGRVICKGDLRLGEALPNPYGEGEAVYWFHLPCAACMRPDKTLAVLQGAPEPMPDHAWLERTAQAGIVHRRLARLARVERAPSGRARCRQCHAFVDHGVWRIALHIFEEGRFSPLGCIHVGCSEAYFGTSEILDRIRRLTPDLGDDDAALIEQLLSAPPAALPSDGGLRKTQAETPIDDADAADSDEPDVRDRRTAG